MFKNISPDLVRFGRTCLANLSVRSCPVRKLICSVQLSPRWHKMAISSVFFFKFIYIMQKITVSALLFFTMSKCLKFNHAPDEFETLLCQLRIVKNKWVERINSDSSLASPDYHDKIFTPKNSNDRKLVIGKLAQFINALLTRNCITKVPVIRIRI